MTTQNIEKWEERKRELAAFMHKCYEVAAKENGWETQKSTRTDDFDKLPDANKETMLNVAGALLADFDKKLSFQKSSLIGRIKEMKVADKLPPSDATDEEWAEFTAGSSRNATLSEIISLLEHEEN